MSAASELQIALARAGFRQGEADRLLLRYGEEIRGGSPLQRLERAIAEAQEALAVLQRSPAQRFYLDEQVSSLPSVLPAVIPRRPADRFSIRTEGPHWDELVPAAVAERVVRWAEEAPRMAGKITAQREALLAYVREQVPGFVGRLEDGRLHCTREEYRGIARWAVAGPASVIEPFALGDLPVVIDDDEEPQP